MNRVTASKIALAVALSCFSFVHAADKAPDATFDLSATSIAAGVGYEWGKGTLHYRGGDYPFSVSGLDVLDVGGTKIVATGEVYHLSKPEDFAGSYGGVAAGATLVEGASTGVMQNHSGVVIHIREQTSGADLKLSGYTMEVKLR
ncbi:MAG TPA: hypothetical protein VMT29_12705 [Steroidobacteraceae bacterium]|nr:hypothetical protein [Steroidobacteraceae bacterium]